MRKIALLIMSIIFTAIGYAQTLKPDNEMILKATLDGNSEYYYPKIFTRYMSGDTTLTEKEYYYLYYGYANQDQYKPLEAIPAADQVLQILERNNIPDKLDAEMIIKYGKEVMAADPFSPSNLNFMTYAYEILGDTLNARISADRVAKVLKAIESSGNGLRETTPWHILWFTHANDFLASKELEIGKRQVVSRSVEYDELKVKKNDIKGYYFDFGRMYWRKPDNTNRTKRVQGIEINGIKVGNKR